MNPRLWDTDQLVGLQAETPLRMLEAVLRSELRIPLLQQSIHRLQVEMRERELLVKMR